MYFYDIYVLSENYDLDGEELRNAIKETFAHRGTSFDDIVAFEPEFVEDSVRQNRWNSFIKKKRLSATIRSVASNFNSLI